MLTWNKGQVIYLQNDYDKSKIDLVVFDFEYQSVSCVQLGPKIGRFTTY